VHFSLAKDHELRQAVEDYQAQLNQAIDQLAEYKHRALTAEVRVITIAYTMAYFDSTGRVIRDASEHVKSAGSRERREREESSDWQATTRRFVHPPV
jgi:hypothetical protein